MLRVPDITTEESLAYLQHLGVQGKAAEQARAAAWLHRCFAGRRGLCTGCAEAGQWPPAALRAKGRLRSCSLSGQCAGLVGGSLLLLQRCASMMKEGASFEGEPAVDCIIA